MRRARDDASVATFGGTPRARRAARRFSACMQVAAD